MACRVRRCAWNSIAWRRSGSWWPVGQRHTADAGANLSRALASFNFGGFLAKASTMADRLLAGDSKGKRIMEDELKPVGRPSMQSMMDSAFKVAERLRFDDEEKQQPACIACSRCSNRGNWPYLPLT